MVAFSSGSWCWTPILLGCIASSARALYIPIPLIISNIDDVLSSSNKTDKIAQAWYTSWNTDVLPLDNVSWSKYTHLTYAFAVTSPSVYNVTLDDPQGLTDFVTAAHKNGVKAALSIGGWDGSIYYSNNVATPENRTAFVQTMLNAVETYNLDGIDFDWEYPGNPNGLSCNTVNANDSNNFLAFLQELRSTPVGANLTLSAATNIAPFYSTNGAPGTDMTEFAKVLDYVEIMNYDLDLGTGPNVTANAPLFDQCAPKELQYGSAATAISAWTGAGMPADQIVLGVAAYGHSFTVSQEDAFNGTSLALYPALNASKTPKGDSQDVGTPTGTVDVCGNPQPAGFDGIFNFWGLFQQGYLRNTSSSSSSSLVEAGNGISYMFDNCSQTPYLYNPNTETMVSFDDQHSFFAKGNFITNQTLRGFSMWEAAGDYHDILLDAVRTGAGF